MPLIDVEDEADLLEFLVEFLEHIYAEGANDPKDLPAEAKKLKNQLYQWKLRIRRNLGLPEAERDPRFLEFQRTAHIQNLVAKAYRSSREVRTGLRECKADNERLKAENEQLKAENERLQAENKRVEDQYYSFLDDSDEPAPEPEPVPKPELVVVEPDPEPERDANMLSPRAVAALVAADMERRWRQQAKVAERAAKAEEAGLRELLARVIAEVVDEAADAAEAAAAVEAVAGAAEAEAATVAELASIEESDDAVELATGVEVDPTAQEGGVGVTMITSLGDYHANRLREILKREAKKLVGVVETGTLPEDEGLALQQVDKMVEHMSDVCDGYEKRFGVQFSSHVDDTIVGSQRELLEVDLWQLYKSQHR